MDYELNAKNHRDVYRIEVVPNDPTLANSYRDNHYHQHKGYNGWGRPSGWGRFVGWGQYQKIYEIRYKLWICYKDNNLSTECPFKDRFDLKFCTTFGVRDHSLQDFPIMLEKIMNQKLVNILSCVPKNENPNLKTLQIITRLNTKIGHDKEKQEITKPIEKNDHFKLIKTKRTIPKCY